MQLFWIKFFHSFLLAKQFCGYQIKCSLLWNGLAYQKNSDITLPLLAFGLHVWHKFFSSTKFKIRILAGNNYGVFLKKLVIKNGL